MADEGEREPEFEAILDALDPNRDGFVTLQEYMAYMISKETDKVIYIWLRYLATLRFNI